MRHLAVFLVAAGGTFAADFYTGQAARAVIGQPTFTAQAPDASSHPFVQEFTGTVLGAVGGVAYANGTLVVADSNRLSASPQNNRVLVFSNVPSWLPAPTDEVPQGVRCPLCGGAANLVLGQPDFTKSDVGLGANQMSEPTAVATDGVRIAVADTANNRVLIWNQIPQANNAPADLVLGQPDMNSNCPNSNGSSAKVPSCTNDVRVPSARSLRGPQGAWIQGNMLFVADDQNHRVLIWRNFPTQNFQPADLVLGQPNFSSASAPEIDITKNVPPTKATELLNPVSVSSDGQRVFVADLGHNRVLIWNSIPTQNQQAADFVVGQPDMTSSFANHSGAGGVCPSTKDSNGNDTYPSVCAATLNFPRFALSDGTRLFIADGGNDRVLVFKQIPQQNGAAADAVLGQISDQLVQTSDTADNPDVARRSSADSIRTPASLAWDGTNLFVTEPFSRRILVFSPSSNPLTLASLRNAASLDVFALGSITIAGAPKENDEITVTIRGTSYKYKVKKDETLQSITSNVAATINANGGDPWVLATPNLITDSVLLASRLGGSGGNSTDYSTSVSANAGVTATTSGSTLSGGQDAAKIAPGSLISIFGANLADAMQQAPGDADPLPTNLGGVEVYIDGRQAPLLMVSPTQINAQMPFEIMDATSVSAYVRTSHAGGNTVSTSAIGVPIVPYNPGIFTYGGSEPRPGVVLHGSSSATGTILIDGVAKAGDVVQVTLGPSDNQRTYSYTVVDGDTLETIRDQLISQINTNDPAVSATAGGMFSRIRLAARTPGPAGNGIPYGAKNVTGSNVLMNTTTGALCCANTAGAPVTNDNPALPGEFIIVYATGMGSVSPQEATWAMFTGHKYGGPQMNQTARVDSLAGGRTANILYSGMLPGAVGLYEVDLELNSDLPTNPQTQLTIAQDVYVSNIITFPVVNPNPPSTP